MLAFVQQHDREKYATGAIKLWKNQGKKLGKITAKKGSVYFSVQEKTVIKWSVICWLVNSPIASCIGPPYVPIAKWESNVDKIRSGLTHGSFTPSVNPREHESWTDSDR